MNLGFLTVNKESPESVSGQIARAFRGGILCGDLSFGDAVPSIRSLADRTAFGNMAGHCYVRGNGMSNDWKGYVKGVKAEAKVGDAEWTGKLRIPLALIGETKDSFQINFCRHRMLTDGTEEAMSWSPYVHNFHDLERFGTIVLR